MLRDDEVELAGLEEPARLLDLFLVEEDDDVDVLLDVSGFAEVGQGWDAGRAVRAGAGELGAGDDGDLELAGEVLQVAGERPDSLLAGDVPVRAGAFDELDVVDDDGAKGAADALRGPGGRGSGRGCR